MKEDKDLAFLSLKGNEFQILGAANEKDRRPRADLIFGLTRSSLPVDRRSLEGL